MKIIVVFVDYMNTHIFGHHFMVLKYKKYISVIIKLLSQTYNYVDCVVIRTGAILTGFI